MIDWLPNVERIPIEGCTGDGSYVNAPWRLVLHTIEGGDMDVAINAVFKPKPCYCPHFTISLTKRRIVQHVRLSWASAALANDPGGVETNREHAIQVEIEGYSADSPNRSAAELEVLGDFIAQLVTAGVPLNLDHVARFVGAEAGTIATKTAAQRMTPAEWQVFDGVCGHQHVPENEHWDPGHLDVATAINHAKQLLGVNQEDIMATIDDLKNVVDAAEKRITAAITGAKPDDDKWMGFHAVENAMYIVQGPVAYHVEAVKDAGGNYNAAATQAKLQRLQEFGFDLRAGDQSAAIDAFYKIPGSLPA